MSYQSSPFGGVGNVEKDKAGGSAASTNAHYGLRDTEAGVVSGGNVAGNGGTVKEAVVYITGDAFNGTTSFATDLVLPAGSIVVNCVTEITEAFTVGNADNIFSIGDSADPAANGFAVAQPDVAAIEIDATGGGTYVPTAALAADSAVSVLVSGTAAAVTAGSGRARVVIRYSRFSSAQDGS